MKWTPDIKCCRSGSLLSVTWHHGKHTGFHNNWDSSVNNTSYNWIRLLDPNSVQHFKSGRLSVEQKVANIHTVISSECVWAEAPDSGNFFWFWFVNQLTGAVARIFWVKFNQILQCVNVDNMKRGQINGFLAHIWYKRYKVMNCQYNALQSSTFWISI